MSGNRELDGIYVRKYRAGVDICQELESWGEYMSGNKELGGIYVRKSRVGWDIIRK